MFNYEKLTLSTLLSKVPEIMNHNFEEVNNVCNKFYSEIKQALLCNNLNVEGKLEIGDSLSVNTLIIRNKNEQVVVSELFDRVKELENKINELKNKPKIDSSTNNQDPSTNNPADDIPDNPDIPNINEPDEPIIPDDPIVEYDYDNCIGIKTYITKLTQVYNLIDDYKTQNAIETSTDRLLATYNRSIHYDDMYWRSLYGAANQDIVSLVDTTYPTFKDIDYVYVKDNIYVDIIHFWAALEGMMNNTNKDLAGWAGDIVDFATYINDNPNHDFPGKGFEYEDICADFDAVYVYNVYTTMNTNIVNAFRNVYLNYLCNTKYMIDVQRIQVFIDYKGSRNINDLYSNSDSALALSVLKMQRQVSNENLTIAKNALQTYIDNLIPEMNNSETIITIPDSPYYADLIDYIPQLENVYILIDRYRSENNINTSASLLLARYNRSIHYNQIDWNIEYGTPESDIIQLVNTTYPSFQNIKYVHILDNTWVDIIHLWAAIEGMFSETTKDLAGWAGDILNFAQHISIDNTNAEFPGPGFREQDIAADFDAIAIYSYYQENITDIVDSFEHIYELYKSSFNSKTMLDIARVNAFTQYKQSDIIVDIYNNSDSKNKLDQIQVNMGIRDEDVITAKTKLQEYIDNHKAIV